MVKPQIALGAVPEHRPDTTPGHEAPIRLEAQAPCSPYRRYLFVRTILTVVARSFSRIRVEGSHNLPPGPSILCFTHQSWADPFYVFAAMPKTPRMYFFGPEQEEMRRGTRNRLMRWSGAVIPYRPGKRGLVAATRKAVSVLRAGSPVAIAGEGRIHSGEGVVLPLRDGPAYLALMAGVPLVPVAINGTGWLGFRRAVRIRVGAPIGHPSAGTRPTEAAMRNLTSEAQAALELLVQGFPDRPKPGIIGRLITELFNDWPGGARPAVPSSARDLEHVGPGSGS
jgi:1-acyl-sn-glycerol-3-phosphate acyltransferase